MYRGIDEVDKAAERALMKECANDNMGEIGAMLFAALKPPTREEIERIMGGPNA